jgi:hypothetical protein
LLPKLDPVRARFVIERIDDILHWENSVEDRRDSKFVELGKFLCEVRAGQYWRAENLKSFDEFLEKRFPESRRKAYYLMSIHEHLPKPIKKELPEIGWAKAIDLVKLARSERKRFDAAMWARRAREMPKEEFHAKVQQHLNGDSEPFDLVHFKLYKGQIPIIEQAIETAALMLGSDKSRGYCLEMICADFLAGAHATSGDPEILVNALARSFMLLNAEQKLEFLGRIEPHGQKLAS